MPIRLALERARSGFGEAAQKLLPACLALKFGGAGATTNINWCDHPLSASHIHALTAVGALISRSA